MKNFSLILMISFFAIGVSQTNNSQLKIKVCQKAKNPESNLYTSCISYTKVTVNVLINDTFKLTLISDNEGYLDKINLPNGKCSIKVTIKNCEEQRVNDIILFDDKVTYVNIGFLCKDYYEGLSRKEKKELRPNQPVWQK
jgi:hypothetical protein